MAHLTLKQGDTVPDFVADPEDLTELERDLTGDESVRFYMEHDSTGDLIVNQPVTEVRESQPEIRYDLSAGETSRQGMHFAEIVVTYGDGAVETVRDDGYFEIDITEPTARDVPPADLDQPDITVGVVDASEVRAPTLSAVETLTGSITGGQTLSNITGANLSIDANGDLNAVAGSDAPSHYNPIYDSNEDGTIDANVDNESTSTGELSVSNTRTLSQGDVIGINSSAAKINTTFTQSTYETTGYDIVPLAYDTNPSDTTLVGRFIARIENDTDGETTHLYPQLGPTDTKLTELDISVTGDRLVVDSGWTEITQPLNPENYYRTAMGKVTGGEGGVETTVLMFGGQI